MPAAVVADRQSFHTPTTAMAATSTSTATLDVMRATVCHDDEPSCSRGSTHGSVSAFELRSPPDVASDVNAALDCNCAVSRTALSTSPVTAVTDRTSTAGAEAASQ